MKNPFLTIGRNKKRWEIFSHLNYCINLQQSVLNQ